ncbi:hypothetical protein YB2330_001726 [Saitoella coloradoensis]
MVLGTPVMRGLGRVVAQPKLSSARPVIPALNCCANVRPYHQSAPQEGSRSFGRGFKGRARGRPSGGIDWSTASNLPEVAEAAFSRDLMLFRDYVTSNEVHQYEKLYLKLRDVGVLRAGDIARMCRTMQHIPISEMPLDLLELLVNDIVRQTVPSGPMVFVHLMSLFTKLGLPAQASQIWEYARALPIPPREFEPEPPGVDTAGFVDSKVYGAALLHFRDKSLEEVNALIDEVHTRQLPPSALFYSGVAAAKIRHGQHVEAMDTLTLLTEAYGGDHRALSPVPFEHMLAFYLQPERVGEASSVDAAWTVWKKAAQVNISLRPPLITTLLAAVRDLPAPTDTTEMAAAERKVKMFMEIIDTNARLSSHPIPVQHISIVIHSLFSLIHLSPEHIGWMIKGLVQTLRETKLLNYHLYSVLIQGYVKDSGDYTKGFDLLKDMADDGLDPRHPQIYKALLWSFQWDDRVPWKTIGECWAVLEEGREGLVEVRDFLALRTAVFKKADSEHILPRVLSRIRQAYKKASGPIPEWIPEWENKLTEKANEDVEHALRKYLRRIRKAYEKPNSGPIPDWIAEWENRLAEKDNQDVELSGSSRDVAADHDLASVHAQQQSQDTNADETPKQ